MKNKLLLFSALVLCSGGSFAQDWEKMSYTYSVTGLATPKIFASSNDEILVVGARSGNHEVSVSTDKGANWTQAFASMPIISAEFGPNGNVYLITARKIPNVNAYAIDTLYRSADGINWTNMGYKLGAGGEEAEFCISGSNVLLFPQGTGSVVDRSTDNGATWTPTSSGVDLIACSFTADTIIQGTSSPWPGGVFYSHDGGATFTKATGISNEAIPVMLPNGDIYACTVGKVYKSTDGGISFSEIPVPLNGSREFLYSPGAKKFFSYGIYGIWESDDCTSWKKISDSLEKQGGIMDIDVSNNYLYATVSPNMVFRLKISSGTQPNSINTVKNTSAVKVYPNPASDKVFIDAAGLDIQKVELIDQLGRRVQTMENQTEVIDVSNVKPGVYFIRITDANDIQTNSKIIIKGAE